MKKLIHIIIIINLNLFFSCKSKNNLSGNYISKGDIYYNLELIQDSTFNFESKYHLDHTKGNGFWKYKDKKIILNSRVKDEILVTEVENFDSEQNNIKINIKEFENEENVIYKYSYISLVINDKETFESISNERILYNGEINKLTLYFNNEKFIFYPKNRIKNNITIFLDLYDSNKFYFKNEKINVRKNKLILGKNVLYKTILPAPQRVP